MVPVVVGRSAEHLPFVNLHTVVRSRQLRNESYVSSAHLQVYIEWQRYVHIDLVVLVREGGIGDAQGHFEVVLLVILPVTDLQMILILIHQVYLLHFLIAQQYLPTRFSIMRHNGHEASELCLLVVGDEAHIDGNVLLDEADVVGVGVGVGEHLLAVLDDHRYH